MTSEVPSMAVRAAFHDDSRHEEEVRWGERREITVMTMMTVVVVAIVASVTLGLVIAHVENDDWGW